MVPYNSWYGQNPSSRPSKRLCASVVRIEEELQESSPVPEEVVREIGLGFVS